MPEGMRLIAEVPPHVLDVEGVWNTDVVKIQTSVVASSAVERHRNLIRPGMSSGFLREVAGGRALPAGRYQEVLGLKPQEDP